MIMLLTAARVWERLKGFQYRIVGAKQKRAHELILCFHDDEFYHLAGFQYLEDVRGLPAVPASKILYKILDGTITMEQIQSGAKYFKMVEPRLIALGALESILDNDFSLYLFNSSRIPFFSRIEADYLIHGGAAGGEIDLVFVSKDDERSTHFCRSAFVERANQNFTAGQAKLTLLYKSKTVISNQTEQIFIDRLTAQSKNP